MVTNNTKEFRGICSKFGNKRVADQWIDSTDVTKIQPYLLDEKIFKSYTIKINVRTLPNGETQIEITDRGTGISVESFKKMCNVGNSNFDDEKTKEEIWIMPDWLKPTAGFGIGLQSIF